MVTENVVTVVTADLAVAVVEIALEMKRRLVLLVTINRDSKEVVVLAVVQAEAVVAMAIAMDQAQVVAVQLIKFSTYKE